MSDDIRSIKNYFPRGRVLTIVSNIADNDGNIIWTKETVQAALDAHGGAYEQYSFVEHDKDIFDGDAVAKHNSLHKKAFISTYRSEAEKAGLSPDPKSETGYIYDAKCETIAKQFADSKFPPKKVGDPKAPHIHLVLKFKSNRRVDEISKWFGLEPYFVDIIKGKRAFADACDYLIHRKQTEKYQYDVSEVRANFDFAKWMTEHAEKDAKHQKYNITTDEINDLLDAVANSGMTLKQAEEAASTPVYLRTANLFREARQKYILQNLPMPIPRIVIYIDSEGKGGRGKTVCAHALARSFAVSEFGADNTKSYEEMTEYIYDAGDSKVALQKYDGQPILTLNEMRSGDMLNAFGGREGVLEMLDMFPTKQSKNIKYGDTTIVAKYIIINSVQPWREFVEGNCGQYTDRFGNDVMAEDVTQGYRRMSTVIVLQEESFDIMFNKGIFYDTAEFKEYYTIKDIKGNFANLARKLSGDAKYKIECQMVEPVLSKTKELSDKQNEKISDVEKIPEEYLQYGSGGIETQQFAKIEQEYEEYLDEVSGTVYKYRQRHNDKLANAILRKKLNIMNYMTNKGLEGQIIYNLLDEIFMKKFRFRYSEYTDVIRDEEVKLCYGGSNKTSLKEDDPIDINDILPKREVS